MIPDSLSQLQYDTVYNFLSLVIASQLFTALFLVVGLQRILPRYRQAIAVAAIVCGIAAYHYFRIFDSFREAFVTDAVGGAGTYTRLSAPRSTRATATWTGSSRCRCCSSSSSPFSRSRSTQKGLPFASSPRRRS